jgi:actin-related protein
MAGDEAAALRNYLQVTPPMEHGLVRNWEDMKYLWDYTFFKKFRVDPAGPKVLLTEPPMNLRANRQRMCQLCLRSMGVRRYSGSADALCARYVLLPPFSPSSSFLPRPSACVTGFRRRHFRCSLTFGCHGDAGGPAQ